MREENKNKPTPKKGNVTKQRWFWPVIYASCSILLVAGVWGYSALTNSSNETGTKKITVSKEETPSVETNAKAESMKYPFKEALLKEGKCEIDGNSVRFLFTADTVGEFTVKITASVGAETVITKRTLVVRE